MKYGLGKSLAATALMGFIIMPAYAEKIRIATDIPFEPFEYTLPDGTFTGFDIDLGNALCSEAGLECSWQDQEWSGMLPGLTSRKYDAVMSGMIATPDRQKHALFSDPYLRVPSAFFVSADSDLEDASEKSLEGKRIGVQRGTVQDRYLSDTYGSAMDIVRYQNSDESLLDLGLGRLDAAFLDVVTGNLTLMELHPNKFKQVGEEISEPHEYFGATAIAMRKGNTELAKKFNHALKAIKASGEYDKIYKEYFHQSPPDALPQMH